MTTDVAARRIKGDFMDDGYIRDFAPRSLNIEIENGKIYDVDDYGHRAIELSINVDGELVGWGAGVSFSPDAGELARVGLMI